MSVSSSKGEQQKQQHEARAATARATVTVVQLKANRRSEGKKKPPLRQAIVGLIWNYQAYFWYGRPGLTKREFQQ